MRASLIKRQVRNATGPLTDADIAYLAEETRSDEAFVKKVLAAL